MQYRKLPRGEEMLSVVGLGAAYIGNASEKEIEAAVHTAVEGGINLFDVAFAEAKPFAPYGNALSGYRDRVFLQGHFGPDYASGRYGWTIDLETAKRSVAWQMEKLRTDYFDFGFIHCLDDLSDLHAVMRNGMVDYIAALKEQGVVRHMAISSHTPALVHEMLDTGLVDLVMFSINPAYDYKQGKYAIGSVDDRQALYRRCEKEGVGITVMKPFCGGQLLDERKSPFGRTLTKAQCIKYALDKPGVLAVLPGAQSAAEVRELLDCLNAPEEELDYSVIGSFAPADAEGKCVYCSHCHPCPMGLQISLINKYYDLALLGDELAAGHYRKLEHKAGECVQCGHCNSRCPFHVDQMARMAKIAEYFGE